MATENKSKRLTIELEFNDEAELGTGVLFFQKLVIVMAKFGLTYFKTATLREDWKTLLQFETASAMMNSIKEYQEDQLRKRAILAKAQHQPEPEEVN